MKILDFQLVVSSSKNLVFLVVGSGKCCAVYPCLGGKR